MTTIRLTLAAAAVAVIAATGAIATPAHAGGFLADVAKAVTPPAFHPLIDGADQTHGQLGRPLTGGW